MDEVVAIFRQMAGNRRARQMIDLDFETVHELSACPVPMRWMKAVRELFRSAWGALVHSRKRGCVGVPGKIAAHVAANLVIEDPIEPVVREPVREVLWHVVGPIRFGKPASATTRIYSLARCFDGKRPKLLGYQWLIRFSASRSVFQQAGRYSGPVVMVAIRECASEPGQPIDSVSYGEALWSGSQKVGPAKIDVFGHSKEYYTMACLRYTKVFCMKHEVFGNVEPVSSR